MARLLSDAVAAFRAAGVPVAHVRFRGEKKREPPFANAYLVGTRNDHANDRTAKTLCEYHFVLHATDRDLDREASIEDALAEADITWNKAGGYDHERDLVTTTYIFEVFER